MKNKIKSMLFGMGLAFLPLVSNAEVVTLPTGELTSYTLDMGNDYVSANPITDMEIGKLKQKVLNGDDLTTYDFKNHTILINPDLTNLDGSLEGICLKNDSENGLGFTMSSPSFKNNVFLGGRGGLTVFNESTFDNNIVYGYNQDYTALDFQMSVDQANKTKVTNNLFAKNLVPISSREYPNLGTLENAGDNIFFKNRLNLNIYNPDKKDLQMKAQLNYWYNEQGDLLTSDTLIYDTIEVTTSNTSKNSLRSNDFSQYINVIPFREYPFTFSDPANVKYWEMYE